MRVVAQYADNAALQSRYEGDFEFQVGGGGASFELAADAASRSRLYAGFHFGFGVRGGQAQGRCVATRVLALKPRKS